MKSLIIAFSMYSKIPMPVCEWEEKDMKYALCFFPLVGALVGAVSWLVYRYLSVFEYEGFFLPVFMAVIPLLITGGIHMDGFLDTMDGISSYQTKEKRLEILKDSNSGAFAIIGGLVYMLLLAGAYSEITIKSMPLIAGGFVLSRALSAYCMLTFPQARKEGLSAKFSGDANKSVSKALMIIYILAVYIFAGIVNPYGLVIYTIAGLVSLIIHYYNCMHNFGGITGDLAGFFLQVFELLLVILCMIQELVF